jgi:hypothetical protein
MCELNSGCVQLSSAFIFDWGLSHSELCDDFLFTNAARLWAAQVTLISRPLLTGMLTDTEARNFSVL